MKASIGSSADAQGARRRPYSAALADAVRRYAELTHRALSPGEVDPAQPALRAVYDDFARAVLPRGPDPNDAEWIALRSGLKPAVREVLDARDARNAAPALAAQGFYVELLEEGIAENPVHGYVLEPRRGPAPPSAPREWFGLQGRVVLYAARDRRTLRRLRHVDETLIRRRDPAGEAALVAEMGRLLGYPDCCVRRYAATTCELHNEPRVAGAARRSTRFALELNNLTLGFFHYIPWTPCRFDCPASLEFARAVDTVLKREHPDSRRAARRVLGLPRLYWNDRLQLLFEDVRPTDDGGFEFRRVSTPWALDRAQSTAWLDWVFYVDVGVRVARASRWRVRMGALELYGATGGRPNRIYLGTPPVWLPFREGSEEQ